MTKREQESHLGFVMKISLVLAAMMSSGLFVLALQTAGEQTRGGQNIYVTQEAHDAVQDQRLAAVEGLSKATAEMTVAINDKMTYILGGLGGFGALLAFLQVYQIRKKQ